jgi:LysR family transcriptional regulator, hydrogen peroxide-inducible genes activator
MISLKQIHYALAVAKTMHFNKAAEACSVSQSTLSSAISELENQLKIQIFERDNKQVLITNVGQTFLDKARQVHLLVDDIYQLANLQQEPLNYAMSIGVIPTIGPYFLPKVLPEVRKQYPKLKLNIIEDQSHVLVDMLRKGELDTAVLALPYAHDGLHAFEFWAEDFLVVAHRDDPISKQKSITSQELKQSTLLLLKEGHCLKDHALDACQFEQKHQDQSLSGTSLHTLTQMVAGQMGVTIVPRMALDQLVNNSPELKAIPLEQQGPHRHLACLTRLNYASVNDLRLLMNIFAKELNRLCHAG